VCPEDASFGFFVTLENGWFQGRDSTKVKSNVLVVHVGGQLVRDAQSS